MHICLRVFSFPERLLFSSNFVLPFCIKQAVCSLTLSLSIALDRNEIIRSLSFCARGGGGDDERTRLSSSVPIARALEKVESFRFPKRRRKEKKNRERE